jgi:hypothetical protein
MVAGWSVTNCVPVPCAHGVFCQDFSPRGHRHDHVFEGRNIGSSDFIYLQLVLVDAHHYVVILDVQRLHCLESVLINNILQYIVS